MTRMAVQPSIDLHMEMEEVRWKEKGNRDEEEEGHVHASDCWTEASRRVCSHLVTCPVGM